MRPKLPIQPAPSLLGLLFSLWFMAACKPAVTPTPTPPPLTTTPTTAPSVTPSPLPASPTFTQPPSTATQIPSATPPPSPSAPPTLALAAANVEVVGRYGFWAYEQTSGSENVVVIDSAVVGVNITDPAQPAGSGQVSLPRNRLGIVGIAGHYLYLTSDINSFYLINDLTPAPNEKNRVLVVDIVEPLAPQIVAEIPADLTAVSFAPACTPDDCPLSHTPFRADYGFVQVAADDLGILDLANPAQPTLAEVVSGGRQRCDLDQPDWSMVAAGDYIYAGHDTQLEVLSRTTLAAPLATYTAPGAVQSVALALPYLYYTWYNGQQGGLEILDVSTPQTPVSIGSYQGWAGPARVGVSNGLIYLGSYQEHDTTLNSRITFYQGMPSAALQHFDQLLVLRSTLAAAPPTTATESVQPQRALAEQTPRLSGPDVWLVQQRLLQLGYTTAGNADGVYGPKTAEAVRQFQSRNGLSADGVVGPQTWRWLFSGLRCFP